MHRVGSPSNDARKHRLLRSTVASRNRLHPTVRASVDPVLHLEYSVKATAVDSDADGAMGATVLSTSSDMHVGRSTAGAVHAMMSPPATGLLLRDLDLPSEASRWEQSIALGQFDQFDASPSRSVATACESVASELLRSSIVSRRRPLNTASSPSRPADKSLFDTTVSKTQIRAAPQAFSRSRQSRLAALASPRNRDLAQMSASAADALLEASGELQQQQFNRAFAAVNQAGGSRGIRARSRLWAQRTGHGIRRAGNRSGSVGRAGGGLDRSSVHGARM